MYHSHYSAPLPKSVRDRLDSNTHPGLELDKYARSWGGVTPPAMLSEAVQLPTIERVVAMSQSPPPGLDFTAQSLQRDFVLGAMNAYRLSASTCGPLTLHLSRATALENAGICLHRIYGFPYLPATGLKGLAKSFAETVWRPTQPDQDAAKRRIEQVFGRASGDAKRLKIETTDEAGGIVFHDAWPRNWPRLQADIVNSHHAEYYKSDVDEVPPPGDWEEPVPVYFLSIPAGVQFDIPLTARRPSEDATLMEHATQWLAGALIHFGAGAKTNSGYGSFRLDGADASLLETKVAGVRQAAIDKKLRLRSTFTLQLSTPAFFAGAHAADPSSCDLRPSSLRGQLRWWWRTLHAAHLSPADLRKLESALWGDTKRAGAIRITLARQNDARRNEVRPFDRRAIVKDNQLPPPRGPKTTQGLTYFTYGMDELKDGQLVRRHYLAPGAIWQATIDVRPGKVVFQEADKEKQLPERSTEVSAELTHREALAALELLCRFGGVGAKCRKGFGAFALPPELSAGELETQLSALKSSAKDLRIALKLPSGRSESPSLDDLMLAPTVETQWTNYWMVLDQVGDSAQAFAQSKKHQLDKKALGLPRNVRPPFSGQFRPGPGVTGRHASPIGYHAAQDVDGKYRVRIFAFPADRLPSPGKSREFLNEALAEIAKHLVDRAQQNAKSGRAQAVSFQRQDASNSAGSIKLPKVGDWVVCRLSTEKTKAGGWKAVHGSLTGPIQNSPDVPAGKNPGDEVTLIVRISKPTEIAFRWPTAADEAARARRK